MPTADAKRGKSSDLSPNSCSHVIVMHLFPLLLFLFLHNHADLEEARAREPLGDNVTGAVDLEHVDRDVTRRELEHVEVGVLGDSAACIGSRKSSHHLVRLPVHERDLDVESLQDLDEHVAAEDGKCLLAPVPAASG